MKFNNIGFIGLGLIGGSIAKKIKINSPETKIYGSARHIETITLAHSMELIENDSFMMLEDFAKCDLIFLCAPVQMNLEYLAKLKNIISSDCIITDVGSTKAEIHNKVIELGLEDNFIGGHPMTGSEKTGLEFADELLLENAYYIITPTAKTTDENLAQFKEFVSSLGSLSLILDYNEHDYATAAVSHLPHMLAYSLVNLVHDIDSPQETMKTIAAGGFRDVTRIAASSPVMWQNICSSNKEKLLDLMDKYIDEISNLRDDIASDNKDELLEYYGDAKEYRESITIHGSNVRSQYFEIYVDLPDEAGAIAIISSLLAFKGINIKNIGIINNREFEEGILHIEFYDKNDKEEATQTLLKHNYTIHTR